MDQDCKVTHADVTAGVVGTEQPFISVIIPVRNEFSGLSQLIPDLLKQVYPVTRWEIVVADGGSSDGTAALILKFAGTASVPIKLVENRGIRSSAGRNAGIALAMGELIIFIDGHCKVCSPSLLADTASIFERSSADCLCRPQPLSGFSGHPMSFNIAEVRRSALGHGRGSMIYDLQYAGVVDPRSSGASYRRSVFDRAGCYDETFDACEDVELNVRVALSGMLAHTDPRLAIEYQARGTLGALIKQMMRYGRGRIRLARKHQTERSLGSLAPLVLCLSLATPLLVWRSGTLLTLTSLPALVYIAVVFAATLQLILKTRRAQLAWALVIYPVIHLGLGFGMILEVLSLSCRALLWNRSAAQAKSAVSALHATCRRDSASARGAKQSLQDGDDPLRL